MGRICFEVVNVGYLLISNWILGIEIPADTEIGPGLKIFHGTGLVINSGSKIGAGVVLRHQVTIGNRGPNDDRCPVIGDGVEIGVGAVVVGPITIGTGSIIGALALVTTDVPAYGFASAPKAVVREGKARAESRPTVAEVAG